MVRGLTYSSRVYNPKNNVVEETLKKDKGKTRGTNVETILAKVMKASKYKVIDSKSPAQVSLMGLLRPFKAY